MRKLTLLLGALLIAGATFACDGGKDKKACCKKDVKKECCKDKKHCDKDQAKKDDRKTDEKKS